MRILLLEDDITLGDAVRSQIAGDGHAVDWFQHVEDADDARLTITYDLMLLDVNLPDGSGLDLLRTIRAQNNDVPILILTARDRISDRIDGLNSGADDYLVKPFDLLELSARIGAVARRYSGDATPFKVFGNLEIDLAGKRLKKNGLPTDLTAREWALIDQLVRHAGQIMSRNRLETTLYEFDAEIESNTLEVYISRIRKKLGKEHIKTIRGLGYRFEGLSQT